MPGTVPDSPVIEFYNGARIFVTGGTGFLGKVLVEKLLRTCPNLEHIYLLVRTKKGKDPHSRLKEIFQDPLFNCLKRDRPDFESKVTCIQGDIATVNLGMNDNDIDFLSKEVTHVFHSAATVRFNETLRTSVLINVLGTLEIVKFCKKCTHLKIFVHVSTAYSNCHLENVKEIFYDTPLSGEDIVSIHNALDGDKLDSITDELIKPWFNTYSFTKAIGETVVRQNAKTLPALIFRPSIVMGTFEDPVPGWVDNIYGPTGIIAAVGAGLLRIIFADGNAKANLVPVDLTVNALICTAWETGTAYKNNQLNSHNFVENEKDLKEKSDLTSNIPIYNFVSKEDNSITWSDFLRINLKHGRELPSIKSLWCYMVMLTTNKFFYTLCTIFLHHIPAIFFDLILYISGQKFQVWKAYERIHNFSKAMTCFSTNKFEFSDDNIKKLWSRLSDHDKKVFNFDMDPMNWDEYLKTVVVGVRTYIFKEDNTTLEKARQKQFLFLLGHRLIQLCLIGGLTWAVGKAYFKIGGFLENSFEESLITTPSLVRNST